MTYDAEIAVLAALSKRVRTMDFSNMFGNDLTRDLWHVIYIHCIFTVYSHSVAFSKYGDTQAHHLSQSGDA